MEIIEIKDILDNNILSIDNNGPFDDAFSKLGKNIKNYIELTQIKNNHPENLNELLSEKKKKLSLIYQNFIKSKIIQKQI